MLAGRRKLLLFYYITISGYDVIKQHVLVWTVGILAQNERDLNQAFFKYGEVKIITNVIFRIDIFFS